MIRRGWLLGLVAAPFLVAASLPDADEIVRKSVANTQADWRAAPQYDFMERDVVSKTGRRTKTYRVIMIDGSPYNELVAQNGKPLPPAQSSEEQRKLREEIARRQHETSEQRQKRVAEYEKERHQDNALLSEMAKALNFRLAGEDTVNGRRCYILTGMPKPGYEPASRETKVLKGMRGKMWIDEQQFQWVKVEADVFRPVEFGLFIARVEPGTRFELEQRPVQGNLWLPSHFSMRVTARVLEMWSKHSAADETYWKYHRSGNQQATAAKR